MAAIGSAGLAGPWQVTAEVAGEARMEGNAGGDWQGSGGDDGELPERRREEVRKCVREC